MSAEPGKAVIRQKESDDRSEPEAAGLNIRPSLMQQTDHPGQTKCHAAAQPRKPPFVVRAARVREPVTELRTLQTFEPIFGIGPNLGAARYTCERVSHEGRPAWRSDTCPNLAAPAAECGCPSPARGVPPGRCPRPSSALPRVDGRGRDGRGSREPGR